MKLGLPEDLCTLISERAVILAKQYGEEHGWQGTKQLLPQAKEGHIGIFSPFKYLVYQDKGTRPFLMRSLEGKIVPMGDGRFVYCRGVGTPGFVNIPGRGQVWRDQKWRHPGIKPTHFMSDALDRAKAEHMGKIKNYLGRVSRGEL